MEKPPIGEFWNERSEADKMLLQFKEAFNESKVIENKVRQENADYSKHVSGVSGAVGKAQDLTL